MRAPNSPGESLESAASTAAARPDTTPATLGPVPDSSSGSSAGPRPRQADRRTLQYEVSRHLATADDAHTGLVAFLHAIVDAFAWDFAALWRVEPGRQHLRLDAACHRPDSHLATIAEQSRAARLGWGDDLPGLVWAKLEPVWRPDLLREPGFTRGPAARQADLRRGFAFPVFHGERLWGILECLDHSMDEPDPDLHRLFSALSGQLIQFIERIEARRDLEIQKALFERLFAQAPVAIAILDDRDRVLAINGEFSRLFGFSAEEITGEFLHRWIVPPGTPGLPDAAIRDLAAGDRVDLEARRISRHGDVRVVQFIGQPVALKPNQSGVYGLFLDLTARKAAEEALRASERRSQETSALQRAILESASYAIISTDPEGRIRTFNSAAERLLDRQAVDVVGQESLTFAFDPEELAARTQELTERTPLPAASGFQALIAGASTGQPNEREWTLVRRCGARIPVLVSISVLRDETATITGYLAIASDITERRRAADELLAAKNAAESANRAKSEFLATMSHEIRTPMNGVIGMSSLLLETTLEAAQREMVSAVKTSAEALMSIIDDLLDLAKIEARRLDVVQEEFDLDGVLDGVVDLLGHEAEQRGLELAVVLDSRIPRFIHGDPIRLRQVLINLVGNAIKFTLEGEVLLCVECADKALRFAVRDTGIGLTPDQREHLFQPFSQADASTTRRFGGSGLGLAICKRVVELMGGQIGVESGPGAGSTFWFTVPHAQSPHPPAPQSLRVLIADDHPTARLSVRSALEGLGIRPDTVLSEDELASRLTEPNGSSRYDLLIVDRVLLGQPALNALRIARASNQGLPKVALTGAASDSSWLRSLLPTADSLLTKPVKRSSLRRLIDELVATPHRPSAPRPLHDPAHGLAGLRVLVVEDNEVNGRVALMMLQKLGCDGHLVTNGRRAIDTLAGQSFNIILMDCHMPEMDGYEATRAIRQLESREPNRTRSTIIALTATALPGERERCLAVGMDDYLHKPVKFAALRSTLVRALSNLAVLSPAADMNLGDTVRSTLSSLSEELGHEAVRELVQMFLAETPPRLDQLRQLAGGPDQTTLRRAAHSLQSSAALVGASQVEAAALRLERLALLPQPDEQRATADAVRLAFDQARPALEDSLAQLAHQ